MVEVNRPDSYTGALHLGMSEGMVVQELGWDEDVDDWLRNEIMDVIDADLVEDAVEAVDVVVLWLRDDEDLVDALVDSLRDLADDGYIWVFTPKVGRPGFVDASDLNEASRTAGLSLTVTVDPCPDWQAYKVVRPRGGRR